MYSDKLLLYEQDYSYHLKNLKSLFNGDFSAIGNVFYWEMSPQGYHFWDDIRREAERDNETVRIPHEAVEWLVGYEKWLEERIKENG